MSITDQTVYRPTAWSGTAEEFWDAVNAIRKGQDVESDHAVLCDVLAAGTAAIAADAVEGAPHETQTGADATAFTPEQHIDKLKEALAWRVRTCATQHIDPIRDPMVCALIYAIGTIQQEQARKGRGAW